MNTFQQGLSVAALSARDHSQIYSVISYEKVIMLIQSLKLALELNNSRKTAKSGVSRFPSFLICPGFTSSLNIQGNFNRKGTYTQISLRLSINLSNSFYIAKSFAKKRLAELKVSFIKYYMDPYLYRNFLIRNSRGSYFL